MAEGSNGGFNFGDLLGGGKGLEVLADLIKSAFGTVTNAYFHRKDLDVRLHELRQVALIEAENIELKAHAHANSMRILADGIRDAAPGTGGITISDSGPVISSLPADEQERLPSIAGSELLSRSERRSLYQNVIRQLNVESVTAIAAEYLEGDTEVSGKPVDPDWAARLFRYVEDISNEEMQMIWGKLLAGEIKAPGSFSYRTLETIRSLSHEESKAFSLIAKKAGKLDDEHFILISTDTDKILPSDHIRLSSIGLIGNIAEDLSMNLDTNTYFILEYQNQVIRATNLSDFRIQVLYTTVSTVGAELLKLVQPEEDLAYITRIATKLKNMGLKTDFGLIIERDESGFPSKFTSHPGWEN